ncbi:hypothetical protein DE146DRAFT_646137 [Phaeosphaeria sp. MPI-PUGE-AT-0046c]|nr:hypothetical protein DE146DRAFT_646137 [Phaeosphaeria sp. MPI-PUGE-AT-0046c]
MAPNIANIPDSYLWFGLGVFTFIAANQVSNNLHYIRSITEIRKLPPSDAHVRPSHLPANPTHQEDAIKTSSLLTLATSLNIDIRDSATKILCQRFMNNNTARRLLRNDLNSDDLEVKHRAQLAYNLLYHNGVIPLQPVSPREGWRLHAPGPQAEGSDAQDLRRRRREAVVIHDGDIDRPLGQEDVYMRDEMGDLERRFDALGEFANGNQSVLREGNDQVAEDTHVMRDLERRFRALGDETRSPQQSLRAEEVVGE